MNIPRQPFFTAEEECELASRIAQGDIEARNTLILRYLRLAVKIAYRYYSLYLDREDLEQEAVIGLIKAAERFDPTRGRFSTIAVQCIHQSLSRAIALSGYNLKMPPNILSFLTRFHRAHDILLQELEREPTDIEIAEYTKISLEIVSKLKIFQSGTKSLELSIFAGNESISDTTYIRDTIPDTDLSPEELTIGCMNTEELLTYLTPIERYVLEAYCGIDTQQRDLADVANELGFSRQTASLIKQRAVEKLKIIIKGEGTC